jgi:uncharacterized membrane protein YkgB
MSEREREKWETQRDRKYYATHKSARIARRSVFIGLLIAVVGFIVSLSLTRVRADIGNGLMCAGIAMALIAIFFTATVRS